jgi:hypothetical protein
MLSPESDPALSYLERNERLGKPAETAPLKA